MENKEIKYINRDFSDFKQALIEYAKSYFPNSYNDFTEASPGSMFIEMAAYVGDVLSFYQDTQIQENFLLYAREKENLMSLAYMLGYRPKVTSAALVDVDLYQLVPSTTSGSSYIPNFDYSLIINENTVLTSNTTGLTFLTQDIVDFSSSSSFDPTEITIYQTDSNNDPVYYLLKKKTKALSGEIKTKIFNFTDYEKFSNVVIDDINIITILDANDSDGNKWYEVPYLGQDTIFEEIRNISDNEPVLSQYNSSTPYILKLKRVPRRFTTRFRTDNLLELEFGSGISSNSDEEIIPNPDKLGLPLIYGISKYDKAYDPSNFLHTKTYGLAPINTNITVRYLTGGGIQSNVPSNDITVIDNSLSSFNKVVSGPISTTVLNSLACNNPTPAVGGKGGDTVDEIRLNSLASFPTQLRVVTRPDYVIRTLSMSPKFGSVSKAHIIQDSQISNKSGNDSLIDNNPLSLSLYILGYNQDKNLINASLATKINLKTYLSQYIMLTDAVNIKDAYIVNIGINFDIIVLPGNNNKEVLTACIGSLKTYFDIDKWQINQPIILSEIYNNIAQVKGVQSVPKVEIVNKYGDIYSQYGYDIVSATRKGIIYPSMDPSIFEIKFPNTDIQGRVISY